MILNEDIFDELELNDDDINVEDNVLSDEFYDTSYTLIFPFEFNEDLIVYYFNQSTGNKTSKATEYLDIFEHRVKYLIENSNYDFMGVGYQVSSQRMRNNYDNMEVQFLDKKMYSCKNILYDSERDVILMYVYVGGASTGNKYSLMKLIVNLNQLYKSFVDSPKQNTSGLVFMGYEKYVTDSPCLEGFIDIKELIDRHTVLCYDIFCYKTAIDRNNKRIVSSLYNVVRQIDDSIRYRDVLHFYKNITHDNDFNSFMPARGWRFKYIGHYCGIDEIYLDEIMKAFPFMYLQQPGMPTGSTQEQKKMKELLREQCLDRGYRLFFRYGLNDSSYSLDLIFDGTLDVEYSYRSNGTEKVCELITYTYYISDSIEWKDYLSGKKKLSREKFDEYCNDDQYMESRNLFRILTILCDNDEDKAYKIISQETI